MAAVCEIRSDDSSDSDVAVVMPQRVKRRRILQGIVPTAASVYSNKVNSCLKLIPDNLSAMAQMEEELQKKQGCEDLETDVPVEPQPVQRVYDLSDSEDLEKEKTTQSERIRDSSPSPPPTLKTPARKKRKGMNRKIRQMEASLQDLGCLLSPVHNTAGDDNDVIVLGSSPPPELTIKVRRRGKIFRINIRPTDPLQKLVESVASRLEVASSQILLLRGDEELDIKETPQSLNLSVADIIDCVLHSSREPGSDQSEGKICLKVQGKDKESNHSVTIGMDEPLQSLMDQYRAAMGLSSRICFMFEGKKLKGRNTPAELGLESDDIIEAWV
ncbi:NFATC2-interacting protein isoform X2 [Hyla sarda]|uniref:NFATC2-interacting protein isoform X2 n=1 Tax=Hyla sarda TaxID=327740 RepID=UPI0024C331A8|nr:NFATC2-interacting protein isoform X2 [Hyla sarda]